MKTASVSVARMVTFLNGKAAEAKTEGLFPVYGSNGKIGFLDEYNHENALILGRVGAYCGSIALCESKFWASDNTIVLKPQEGYNLRYLRYRLSSWPLRSYAGGAAQPLLTHTILSGVKIPVVTDLLEQARIASILSAYDDLIENNRRRIQLLEQSARLLYKEWFVHLRFPGHERLKIKNGVPEGWERKKIKEVLAPTNRAKKIKLSDYQKSGTTPCIDQSRDFIGGYTDDLEARMETPLPVIIFGDHTRILKYIDFPFACGADGTQLIVSNTTTISQPYLYFALDSIDLSNYFYARHFKFLKDQEVFEPKLELMKEFSSIVTENLNQIRTLRDYTLRLERARDLLLPKLMSGEVVV